MRAGTRGGKRQEGSTDRSDSPRLGASSQIWLSLSKAGSALLLPRTDMKTPTLRSNTRTGLSPCPTFAHSCLGQTPVHWGPRAVWGGGAEVPGSCWPHRITGEKVSLPPALLRPGKLSPPQHIPPLWGEQLGEGQGDGAASKPSSAPLRVGPSCAPGDQSDLGPPVSALAQAWEE